MNPEPLPQTFDRQPCTSASTLTREGQVPIGRGRISGEARHLLARVQQHTLALPSWSQDAGGRWHQSHCAPVRPVNHLLPRHDAAQVVLFTLPARAGGGACQLLLRRRCLGAEAS